jgi:hypothetical protein
MTAGLLRFDLTALVAPFGPINTPSLLFGARQPIPSVIGRRRMTDPQPVAERQRGRADRLAICERHHVIA